MFLLSLSFYFSKKKGNTPLHIIAKSGQEQIAITQMLLERGANVEALDKVLFSENNIFFFFFSRSPNSLLLLFIIYSLTLVSLILVFLFFKKEGNTPLHIIAWIEQEQIAITQMLLERGANVEALDKVLFSKNNIFFFFFLRSSNSLFIIIYSLTLFSLLPVFLFFKKEGNTPLHIIAWKGKEQITQMLLERGANVEALDKVLFKKWNYFLEISFLLFLYYDLFLQHLFLLPSSFDLVFQKEQRNSSSCCC